MGIKLTIFDNTGNILKNTEIIPAQAKEIIDACCHECDTVCQQAYLARKLNDIALGKALTVKGISYKFTFKVVDCSHSQKLTTLFT